MQRFTKDHRLKKADEFSSVFIFRKVKAAESLKIHYKPNGLQQSRLGIVVSKKVHKRANWRNYMKRVIRELFRCNQASWLHYDIIVRVHKAFNEDDFQKIKQEFQHLTKHMASNIAPKIVST